MDCSRVCPTRCDMQEKTFAMNAEAQPPASFLNDAQGPPTETERGLKVTLQADMTNVRWQSTKNGYDFGLNGHGGTVQVCVLDFLSITDDCTFWDDFPQSSACEIRIKETCVWSEASFRRLLTVVENAGNLVSLRCAGLSEDQMGAVLHASRRNDSLQWLFLEPMTERFAKKVVARAIPWLRLEVLNIGVTPGEEGDDPAEKLLEGVQQNYSLGVFRDDNRKRVAEENGIVGLTVRPLQVGDFQWYIWEEDQEARLSQIMERNVAADQKMQED